MGEEVNDVAGNLVAVLIRHGKHVVAVALVSLDHGNYLGGVNLQVGLTNTVVRVRHADGHAAWRNGRAVVDVVHAFHLGRRLGVDFQNHLVGDLQPGLVVTDSGRGNQQAIGGHAQHFHHGDVHVAQEAEPCMLRHVGQVHVDEVDLASVDRLACGGIGVEGQTLAQGSGFGHHAIALRGRGRTGPDIDLVGLALGMFSLGAGSNRLGQGLGVTGSGKAAHADIDTVRDQGSGLFGRHDAREEFWVTYAICDGHCMLQTQRPRPDARA